MKKNFYHKIGVAELLAEVLKRPDDAERGKWLLQLALDLESDEAKSCKTDLGKELITRTKKGRKKAKESGKIGAKKRWEKEHENNDLDSNPINKNSDPIASSRSSSRSSINNKDLKDKPLSSDMPDNCPHADIIKVYHSTLNSLPIVQVWNDKDKAQLRARWREDKDRQSVEWWQVFFTVHVKSSPFLMGNVRDWRASLSWICKSSNFAKIMNGQYQDQGGSNEGNQGNSSVSGTVDWAGGMRTHEDGDFLQ